MSEVAYAPAHADEVADAVLVGNGRHWSRSAQRGRRRPVTYAGGARNLEPLYAEYLMSAIPPIIGQDTGGTEPAALDASTLAASLTVAVLPTSVAWYRDVLGFTVARTFERGGTLLAASLRAGAVAILLTQDDGARGTGSCEGRGNLAATHDGSEHRRARKRNSRARRQAGVGADRRHGRAGVSAARPGWVQAGDFVAALGC